MKKIGMYRVFERKETVKMRYVEKILIKEKQELKRVIKETKKRLQTAPQGHIRIARKEKRTEYYYKSGKVEEKRNGTYVKKNEKELVQRIIQREYDEDVLFHAEKRLKIINGFLNEYERTGLDKIFDRMNKDRKVFVTSPILSDKEYIKQWQSVTYEGNTNYDIKGEIITERGEHVRSKSEKIIADKLFMLGIPYRYEYPLTLDNNIMVYPDFTILKVETREEIYLEHLGLMDDVNYVENAMRKMNTYARNGIHLGVNLLITYETNKMPLNTKHLDELLTLYFIGK